MKNRSLILFFVLGSYSAFSQAIIGRQEIIEPSAQLDVFANNKGVLIPRIKLTSSKDTSTITDGNVESLLVFNTEITSDIKPGYYYWYSNKWNRIIISEESQFTSGIKVITDNYVVQGDDYTIIAKNLSKDITIALPDAGTSKGRVLVINQFNTLDSSGKEVKVMFNTPVAYSDAAHYPSIKTSIYGGVNSGSAKITLQSDGLIWYVITYAV